MNKKEALHFYKNYNDKYNAYELTLKTMLYDMATIASNDGHIHYIEIMTILSDELFDCEAFDINIYVDYLIDKYSKLYL